MHNNKAQGKNPQHINRFWIIGIGRFGQIAISRITRHYPDATLTAVDKRPGTTTTDSLTTVCAEATSWLAKMLVKNAPVDVLVPAIPEHVAADWLSLQMKNHGFMAKKIPIPDDWLLVLPHAIRGACGQAFVSHADFLCPDNCSEPNDRCTHTGKPRPADMFRLLAEVKLGDILPVVLRSHQLLPGVGGIYPADLWQALDVIRSNTGKGLMVATACRCHGVVDFIRFEKPGHLKNG